MRLIFITLVLFLYTGCSTIKPSIAEYKIAIKTVKPNNLSSGCQKKSLKVSEAFSSNSLMSLRMNYVQDESKIYSYSQAQWSNSPNKEITSQIVKSLRESKLFQSVQNSKSRSRSDLVLETNIEDFMQYFSKNLASSHSSVVINFTLIDSSTNEVLSSKTFSSKRDTKTLDASGGVQGLNLALEDVLNQGLKFLNEVCSDTGE